MKIKEEWKLDAIVDENQYKSMYEKSITENENFWKEQGKRLIWRKDYTKVKDIKYSAKDVNIKWYYDGALNVAENCIDRHAKLTPEKIAIIWEGDDPSNSKKISYKELLREVCKTANALRKVGLGVHQK